MARKDATEDISVGFIGTGRMGKAMAIALQRVRYRISAVTSRTFTSAQTLARSVPGCRAVVTPQSVADSCQLVFIVTPDAAILDVARRVKWYPGQWVVHCSGALSLDCLVDARQREAEVASFHPLQTFGAMDTPIDRLHGITFAIEGGGQLLKALEALAVRLGGKTLLLTAAQKPIYHAAAVMSCGYITTLLWQAVNLWQHLGFSQEMALAGMLPLARATLDNIDMLGLADSATGPVWRGDVVTIRSHLESMERLAPKQLSLYCRLGLMTLDVAHQNGTMFTDQLCEIGHLLQEYASRFEESLPR